MDWLNIKTPMLRAPEYIGSDPVDRATWLNLLGYCAEQENGGRLAGARAWKDRMWQQLCGVTLAEISADTALFAFEGDDLLVWGYPREKEELVRQRREAGKLGGSAKTKAKTKAVRENGAKGGRPKNVQLSEENALETKANGEQEPKQNLSNNLTEEEGNRKGMEEEEESATAGAARGGVGLDYPAALDSPKFRTDFGEWMRFRRGLGKKPKDWAAMFQKQIAWLEPFGQPQASEILAQSIRNGWQGLFEPKANGANGHAAARPADARWQAAEAFHSSKGEFGI